MKTRRPPCLDWREKLALRHEDLSPADQQALDAHVRTCDTCTKALADYHFFEARLDALPPPAIKPLPRLSPHFFEQTRGVQTAVDAELVNASSIPTPATRRPVRKPGKIMAATWRALSIVAVLCLLLSAGALFRLVYLSRLASHPSGDALLSLNQHTAPVYDAGWSPDGHKIATGSADGTVKIWDALSGSVICTYSSSDIVYSIAWSPDSTEVVSGNGDGTVKTFDAATCASIRTYTGHTSSVMSVAWSHDGKYLASGSNDHSVLIWDVLTGGTLKNIPFSDVAASVAWAPGKDEVAIGAWDRTTQIWDIHAQTPTYETSYPDAVNAVAWSPDGNYVAIGIQNGTVEVRNTATWSVICTYTQHADGVLTYGVLAVAWSPNGKYIASGGYDDTVKIWNPFSSTTPTLMTYTQTDHVSSVSWSLDGKKIVSGSWDDTAKVWAVPG